MLSIATLNAARIEDAVTMILPFIERSPYVAARVAARRGFSDFEALADVLEDEILSLDEQAFLDLALGHPELAPVTPDAMTLESQSEQARLGLNHIDEHTKARLAELNRLYKEKFGFPFILALHKLDRLADIFEAFEGRLLGTRASETIAARNEIASVSRARVRAAFGSCKGAGYE